MNKEKGEGPQPRWEGERELLKLDRATFSGVERRKARKARKAAWPAMNQCVKPNSGLDRDPFGGRSRGEERQKQGQRQHAAPTLGKRCTRDISNAMPTPCLVLFVSLACVSR